MLGTLVNTRSCVRRVVSGLSFGTRWCRVRRGIDHGAADKGQCNKDNQTSEQS
jgi:hypothetical protein